MRDLILKACYSLLVPIVRSLLARGIGYRQFSEVVKAAYVNVTQDDFGIRGRPTNISRVSSLTGLSRREVRAVRDTLESYDYDRRGELSPLSDLLHRWFTEPAYQDESGHPIALPQTGGRVSFERLVGECASQSSPSSIRDELLTANAIEENDDGALVARRRYVVPSDSDKKLLTSLSFSLQALASTVEFNTRPGRSESGRIERFIESNPAPAEKRDELKLVLRRRIVEFSESIDNLFGAETTPNRDGRNRVGVGVFYFEDSD